MRWKRYLAYKNSGVEWLGEVPEHWHLGRLKQTVNSIMNGIWGEELKGSSDYWCVRVADFDRIGLSVSPEHQTMRSAPEHQLSSRLLRPYDLLIEKSGGGDLQPVGAVVWFPFFARAACSNFIARIRPKNIFDSRFLVYAHYHLYEAKVNTRSIKQTTGIQNLDTESYFNEVIAYPTRGEQRKIASFLDCETGRIDGIIAKKQRQLELLEEKRTALITQAVTKGLNSNVKMKDSGVEWLGEVPEHWQIMKLKHVASLRSGQSITSDDMEPNGRYPVYGGNGVRGYSSEYTHEGDFVIVGRQGALCGCINYASGRFWASEHAVVGTPTRPISILWLGELLRSMNLNRYSMTAAQPGLSVEFISNLSIPFPSRDEQCSIERYLDTKLSHINALEDKIQQSIDTLQEYRSSLISAAVTGQIDVREEVV